jgi:anti-sigma regulatory factor (Ser/Thr protein kinase)
MHPTRRSRPAHRSRGQRSARLHRPRLGAPNAENANRHAAKDRSHRSRGIRARQTGRIGARESLELRVALDVRAPATVRTLVAPWLRDRVAADVLDDTQLVLSELVTSSVRHSGASAADLAVVRVRLTRDTVRLEVQDAGRDGVVALRPPNLACGDGFALNVVRALSQRWGRTRVAAGGTRVWADVARTAAVVHRPAHQSDDQRS